MKKFAIPISVFAIGILLILFSIVFSGGKSQMEIKVQKASLIMPAAHKVYANPDALEGEHYLFKAKITNSGKQRLENVTVSFEVPGFIEWTEITSSGCMIPGQSLIATCYPVFDQKITEKTTESVEKVNIKVDWNGASEEDIIEESFSFKMLNRNEYAYTTIPADEIASWADVFYNNDLIACFVTPNDPIIKYYTQKIQEKVLKGESAVVSQSPEQAVRFMLGIYEATRMAHMVYSGTKGIPSSLEDVQTMIQHVRLPREVVTGNTGLCIELSTLYASILSAAGLNPVIFMIPGHAYPGVKVNGQYFAIEATGIGGEGLGGIASAEDAFKMGMKEIEEFIKAIQMGDPRYSLVDIHDANKKGVVSMNLDDDQFLRQKVDEIAENFSGSVSKKSLPRYESQNASSQNRFPGPLSFIIPSGWQTFRNPAPNFPMLIAQVVSPDQIATVSVYQIPSNNPANAMSVLAQNFSQSGLALDYSMNGSHIQGTSSNYSSVFIWKGRIAQNSGGYRVVAVGADQNYYNHYSGIINSVYNSIK